MLDSALRTLALYEAIIEGRDLTHLRHAIEEQALVVAGDAVLFQLLGFFTILDHLQTRMWHFPRLHRTQSGVQLRASRANDRRKIWYDHAPRLLRHDNLYRRTISTEYQPPNRSAQTRCCTSRPERTLAGSSSK